MRKLHPKSDTNEVAEQIISKLEVSPSVLAIFLSGSTSKGGNDIYSDVDINVVVEDKSVFDKELQEIINAVADLKLQFTPPSLPNVRVIYLNNLAKYDVSVYSPKEIKGKIGIEQIIKDPQGILIRDTEETLGGLGTDNLTQNYVSMALADIIAIPREIKRNNIFEARANLDEARSFIATYINLANGVTYFGYDDFMNITQEDIKQHMLDSLAANDRFEGILNASLSLLQALEILAVFPAKLTDQVRDYLTNNAHT